MKLSTRRILTTHTGSLPRPQDLLSLMTAKEAGEAVDHAALDSNVRAAVAEVVRAQVESRIDIVNDGEMSKIGYSTYVKDRLSGFEGESPGLARSARLTDLRDFPDYAEQLYTNRTLAILKTPACNGPIAYRDAHDLALDIENLKDAISGVRPE